tara:strand:- start:168 stop:287 length:120 start_codon:yes stop_codon:yes gene_type:complete
MNMRDYIEYLEKIVEANGQGHLLKVWHDYGSGIRFEVEE